jgi:hypothetical protein
MLSCAGRYSFALSDVHHSLRDSIASHRSVGWNPGDLYGLGLGLSYPELPVLVQSPAGAWTIAQNYSVAWTFIWTTNAPGSYAIEVDVRDQTSSVNYDVNVTVPYDINAPIAQRNLLANPSFETGTPSPWTLEDPSSQAYSIKNGGVDGNYYLEAYTRDATPGHQSVIQMLGGTSPGQSYTFSIFVKTDNGRPGTLSIDLWAFYGTMEGGASTVNVTGAWRQVQYTFNARYSNSNLKAQLVMQTPNQNFDFDAAQLTLSPVGNPSFETGDPSPWTLEDPNSQAYSIKNGGVDGNYYLEAYTRDATPGHQSVIQMLGGTSPGQSYTFSIWVKTDDGRRGTVSVNLWAIGGTMEGGATTVAMTGTWTLVQYTLNTHYSNVNLKLQMVMQTPNQNFDFDNAALRGF